MPSLVVIGQQIKEKQRRSTMCLPSLNRVKELKNKASMEKLFKDFAVSLNFFVTKKSPF